MAKTTEELADAMFKMVSDATKVKKKLKPMDLIKAMIQAFGEDEVDKKGCKQAIKLLINSERCVYTYFGGSFIELPHREGAAND
jgi:hypothetical protein